MPNRNMQAKYEKACAQRSAAMQDVILRETQIFKEGLEQNLSDLVAAYKGKWTFDTKKSRPRQVSDNTKACTAAFRRAHAIARRTA
jgi:hypothetical protein